MHEFALAQNILSAIEKSTGSDFLNMTKIHIEVGEFAGIVNDSLQFGLEVSLKDRELDNVAVEITPVPAVANCECTHEYTIKDIFESCPQCQSLKRTISSGTDVIVKSVEIRD
jgi:hydrogenase nickel incorporation protein HypA/HybF